MAEGWGRLPSRFQTTVAPNVKRRLDYINTRTKAPPPLQRRSSGGCVAAIHRKGTPVMSPSYRYVDRPPGLIVSQLCLPDGPFSVGLKG